MENRKYLVKVLNSYFDNLIFLLSLNEMFQDKCRNRIDEIRSKKVEILLILREDDKVVESFSLEDLKQKYKVMEVE